jgi:hypothetical protein
MTGETRTSGTVVKPRCVCCRVQGLRCCGRGDVENKDGTKVQKIGAILICVGVNADCGLCGAFVRSNALL